MNENRTKFWIVHLAFLFSRLTEASPPSSWSVCSQTGPELPPHPGRLCWAPFAAHCGQDQLNLTVLPAVFVAVFVAECNEESSTDHCVHFGYRKFPTDLSALLLGDLYYTRLSLSGVSEGLSHSALLELYQILHANLSSNVSKVCHKSRDLKRFLII